jgi:hypothetical protein
MRKLDYEERELEILNYLRRYGVLPEDEEQREWMKMQRREPFQRRFT